jgi:hypothetical protein
MPLSVPRILSALVDPESDPFEAGREAVLACSHYLNAEAARKGVGAAPYNGPRGELALPTKEQFRQLVEAVIHLAVNLEATGDRAALWAMLTAERGGGAEVPLSGIAVPPGRRGDWHGAAFAAEQALAELLHWFSGRGQAFPWDKLGWDLAGDTPLQRRLLSYMWHMPRARMDNVCPAVWGDAYATMKSSQIASAISKVNSILERYKDKRRLRWDRGSATLAWETR